MSRTFKQFVSKLCEDAKINPDEELKKRAKQRLEKLEARINEVRWDPFSGEYFSVIMDPADSKKLKSILNKKNIRFKMSPNAGDDVFTIEGTVKDDPNLIQQIKHLRVVSIHP